MSRNFNQPKHYDWKEEKDGGQLVCRHKQHEGGATLFCVYMDEGKQAIALEAFWQGYHKGERDGAEKLRQKFNRMMAVDPSYGLKR